MHLDKDAARKAKAIYELWNEEKFIDEVLGAGIRSEEEKWPEYNDLVEFCRSLRPEQTIWEEQLIQEERESYCRSIIKFEEKKKTNGKGTSNFSC